MKSQDPSHPELPGVHIMAVPVISTSHIGREDALLLLREWADSSHSGILAEIGDGNDHLLHIGDDSDIEAEWQAYSQEFRWLLDRLQRMGFSYVRFAGDSCHPPIPGWPVFDW